MRLKCLFFLALMSVVAIIECKPLSNDVEKTPCVDCEQPLQKNFRRKRSYQWIFKEIIPLIRLNLGCHSCHQVSYTMTYSMPLNQSPDIYVGNGQNNVNHVVINGANKVYIGNGAHNTNYVSINN